MTTRKRPGHDLRALCAQVHEDDCVDPRTARRPEPQAGPNHKDLQLCKQVQRVLAAAIRCRAADPVLSRVHIAAVEPAPDSRRLRITAEVEPGEIAPEQALLRLNEVRSGLRCEVAAAISRKRTPELLFVVVPLEKGGAA